MTRQLVAAVRSLIVFTVLLGVIYPVAVFALGRVTFRGNADGSPVRVEGRVVGSDLLGQAFDGDSYFHSRPSAAGTGYDPRASSASNLGPNSDELLAVVEERRSGGATTPDALTASASGLDPHITPDNARSQVERVATARGISVDAVRTLVDEHVQGRTLGLFGEERVNVLRLNLALDRLGG